jgi:hypothetical protein
MSAAVLAALIAAVSATAALIGTVASIIYQGRQFHDQRRLLQNQAELFSLQAEGLRDEKAQSRIQEAGKVKLDTWLSRLVPRVSGDSPPTVGLFPYQSDKSAVISSARVCNNSARPIRDVQVRFDSAHARWVRPNDGTKRRQAPLSGLRPSGSVWFDSDYQDAHTYWAVLRFTDMDGHNWQTSLLGEIDELATRDW